MADQRSNIWKKRCLDWMEDIDLRAVLVMTNTEAGTDLAKRSDTCYDFLVDEFDGYNSDPDILSVVSVKDDNDDRGALIVTYHSLWTGISGGSDSIQGVILVEWLDDNLLSSHFLSYHEFPYSYTAIGNDLRVEWSTAGAVYIYD